MTYFEAIDEWAKGNIDDNKVKLILEMELAGFKEELPLLEAFFPEMPLGKSEESFWEWQSQKNNIDETKQCIKKIEQFLSSINNGTITYSKTPIVWNGSQADLARIYKALRDSGIVNITARDFSKHFLTKQGQPMPEDFTESKGDKQPEYSTNGTISGLQKGIRGMKPESGE